MSAAAFRHNRLLAVLATAVAMLVALLAAASPADARRCRAVNKDPNEISIHKAQTATLCLINNKRRAHHLGRVSENHRLDRASMQHAQDMARRNFFEHGDFVGRIKSSDYLAGAGSWMVGENIAWGGGSYATPKSIVRMWMNSPPHRHNILDARFREIGIGIARGTPAPGVSGATYATDFGARG